MKKLYREMRTLGLNATRAFIAAKMMSKPPSVAWCAGAKEAIARGMQEWSDHHCRVFIENGLAWPVHMIDALRDYRVKAI